MPSWSVHSRASRLLGFPSICSKVDEYIDVGRKNVLGFDVEIHDLGRSNPYIFVETAKDVLSKFGYDGLKCFILHHVLDYIEKLYLLMYDDSNIKKKVVEKFRFIYEIDDETIRSGLVEGFSNIMNNIDELLKLVKSSADLKGKKKDLEEAAYVRLRGIINSICKIVLMKAGCFSRGFRVRRDIYLKLVSRVSQRVRKLGLKLTIEDLRVLDDLCDRGIVFLSDEFMRIIRNYERLYSTILMIKEIAKEEYVKLQYP